TNETRLFKHMPDLQKISLRTNRHWSTYVDYYDPRLAPLIHYFESMEELKALIQVDADKFDVKNARVKGPAFFGEEGGWRDRIANGWREVILWPDLGSLPIYDV
ncbi:hypothetical protein HDU98_005208, partial [Podochytrium sp. JEL0797]